MSNLKPFILVQFIVILTFPITVGAISCEQAHSLVKQAYYFTHNPSQQKELLQRALKLCPTNAPAHNNLGVLLENENNHTKALYHYRQTLKYCPDCFQAWLGIGDVYYQQSQFPLSLEAYLHACTLHNRARQRVTELLHDNRYRTAEIGTVLKRDSLNLLYNRQRLQQLHKLANECVSRFKSLPIGDTKALLQTAVQFPNLLFETGNAQIVSYQPQLDEIATALKQTSAKTIYIHGHADIQAWANLTQHESDEHNWQLSKDRADSIKNALVQRSVPMRRIRTYAYGSSQPVAQGTSDMALAQNRRVEIEVK